MEQPWRIAGHRATRQSRILITQQHRATGQPRHRHRAICVLRSAPQSSVVTTAEQINGLTAFRVGAGTYLAGLLVLVASDSLSSLV